MLSGGIEPIPGYRLSRHLGTGGFGQVWEGVAADGSRIAMKFLDCRNKSSQLVGNEIRLLMNLRELQHPNVIQLHSVCAHGHYIILGMELADGSLRDLQQAYLEQTGKNIPAEHLLDLLAQAATALDFLAAQKVRGFEFTNSGLQHCDIKPSNLLLVNECLKVADFGLCTRQMDPSRRNSFMGTPPYAAPEQYEGRISDRTDQYALAVTYCELCTGGRGFAASGKLAGRAPAPIDLSRMRERERQVVARALEPKWFDRWPNCQAFVAALREAVQTPRPAPRTPPPHARTTTPRR